MSGPERREQVRAAVRRLIDADRARDERHDVAHYRKLFPGFTDVVDAEFAAAAADSDGADPRGGAPAVAPTELAAPPPAAVRTVGPYRILREIGRGGMGVVYEAEDARLGRRVALKVLPHLFAGSDTLRMRFEREASIAARLDHPHICPVYETGEADGTPYMAMRFVEGQPLSALIAASRESGARAARTSGTVRLPAGAEAAPGRAGEAGVGSGSRETRVAVDRVLALFDKAARALHVAHETGLVHRDVKPHNVMVTEAGEPVLLDFGLAREEEGVGHGLTQTGSLLGTPSYMSPEQLTAQRIRLDRRTDVYSLGVSLYECLTLRLPFEAPTTERLYQKILSTEPEDPRRLNPALPVDVRVILQTAMEKDRGRRYQTALAFAEDLRRVRALEPIAARPAGRVLRMRRWVQRNPTLAGFVAALVAGLGASSWLLVRTDRALEAVRRAESDRAAALADARREATEKTAALDRSEQARRDADAALRRARGQALLRAAMEHEATDPALSLLCALEAARDEPEAAALSAVHAALVAQRNGRVLRGHEGALTAAAFSPDGGLVVTAAEDGTARIWDAEGSPGAVLRGHEGPVVAASFSPQKDSAGAVLTASSDGTARLWRLDGSTVAVLDGAAGPLAFARFSPDGRSIVTGGREGRPRLWRADGSPVRELRSHHAPGTAVHAAFGLFGFLTVLPGGHIECWTASGEHRLCIAEGPELWNAGPFLAVDALRSRLVTATAGGVVAVWSGAPVARLERDRRGWRYRMTGIGEEYALVAASPPVEGGVSAVHADWVGTATGRVLPVRPGTSHGMFGDQVLVGHREAVTCIDLSAAGLVLTGSRDGTARLWDAATGAELAVLGGHVGAVVAATFDPWGTRVLTASTDGTARIRDTVAAESGWRTLPSEPPGAPAVPGTRTVTSARPGVAFLRTAEGRTVATLRYGGDATGPFLTSPSGRFVVTPRGGGGAVLWSEDGARRTDLDDGDETLAGAAFPPSEERVLVLYADGDGAVFESDGPRSGRLRCLRERDGLVRCADDGSKFLLAAADATARIFDASGSERAVLSGHAAAVRDADFSDAGDAVITVSRDGTARIWETTGREIATLRVPGIPFVSARFEPDGDRVVTVGSDRIERTWTWRPSALLALAESRLDPDLRDVDPSLYGDTSAAARRVAAEAASAVESLSARLPFAADVVAALEANGSLGEAVRARALEIARNRSDDPSRLADAAWSAVLRGDADPASAREAHERAVAASRASAPGGGVLAVLGAAEFRRGLVARAVATLRTADASGAGPRALPCLAFLAMALHEHGDRKGAFEARTRLRSALRASSAAPQGDVRALIEEMERRLVQTPRKEAESARGH